MIGHASVFDLSLWLVPAAFYVFDNLVLLEDHEFLVVETATGKCSYKFAVFPFQILGKTLYIEPLLVPYALVAKANWLETSQDRDIRRTQRSIALDRHAYLPFRALAVAAACYLFVLGPLLTVVLGLLPALIVVLALHVGALFCFSVLWYPNLRKIGATRPALAALLFEYLICPGSLPNVCRRLSLRYVRLPVDGVLLLKSCADQEVFSGISSAVVSRLEELELADADCPESCERYARYRMELAK